MLLFALLLWVLLSDGSSIKHSLKISLPEYGSFNGKQITTTRTKVVLPRAVDAWLGMEYATQPVGKNRFAPPQWPAHFDGVKNATSYGLNCLQGSVSNTQSEACLYFNVWRTAGIPMEEKLPVLIWIHGGSFVTGSGKDFDGATFVGQSETPLMVVTFNYRISSLGSLPSKLFEELGLLNLGLLDQRLLLEFFQKYAEHFGADPKRITLGGQSAGGHSVGIHYFHNYGKETGKPLFSRAIMASGSVTARAFPPATYPLYEAQFEEYMAYLHCPTSGPDALDCLRSADIDNIQNIQLKLYNDSKYNITWPFQPVLGGHLLEKPGSVSGIEKTFFDLPLLTSSTTDEGTGFVPTDLQTDNQFHDFFANLAPGLSQDDLGDLGTLYPSPFEFPKDSPYTNSPKSGEFSRVAAAYSDYSYICPVQETAVRVSPLAPVWKARWNTPNFVPSWKGVPHASDANYFNGRLDTEYPEISKLYHGYYASFVAAGDPNAHAIEGAPLWNKYVDGDDAQQLVVNPSGAQMEKEATGIREKQCQWWRDPERMKRLHK